MSEEVQKAINVIKEMARQVVANLETHEVLQHAIQTVESELKGLPAAAHSIEQEIASDIEKV